MAETLTTENSYEHRRRLFRSIWECVAEDPAEEKTGKDAVSKPKIIRTARMDGSSYNHFVSQKKKMKVRNITMACKKILKLRSNDRNNDKEAVPGQVPICDKQKSEETTTKESKTRPITPATRPKRKVFRKKRHKDDVEVNKDTIEYSLEKDFSLVSLASYSIPSISPRHSKRITVDAKPVPEEKLSTRIIVNKVQDFVKIKQRVAKRAMAIALRSLKTNKSPREVIERYELPLAIIDINF